MNIPKQVFAICKIVPKEPTRYALDAIQLERHGTRSTAAATDGCRILSASWPNPPDPEQTGKRKGKFSILVPAADCTRILKECKGRNSDPIQINEDSADPTIQIGPHKCALPIADGRFPDWRSAVPRYAPDECVTIGVDPKLLGNLLLAVAKTLDPTSTGSVRLTILKNPSPSRPILIEGSDRYSDVDVVAAIMPIREPFIRERTTP